MAAQQSADSNSGARPVISLRLEGSDQDDGEIRLEDLAKIAEATQMVVRRIGRSLVGQRRAARASKPVVQATALSLVGLFKGSTVLEIAGRPVMDEQDAFEFEIPTDLSELSLTLLSKGFCALAGDDLELPVGFDSTLVRDFDDWLKSLTRFDSIAFDSSIGGKDLHADLVPAIARRRLGQAAPQPILPFVSPTEQALQGKLYALNLNTGSFSIEDDAGHKIRLVVPIELRKDAAKLVDLHVRAVGKPELVEGRLRSFEVARLELAPDVEGLYEQEGFFDPHELKPPAPGDLKNLEGWAIDDLTDEEAANFMDVLADLR